MAIGSPFDERAAELNVRRQWRQWAGTFSSTAYAPHVGIEYNAIRNAAAVIDISPLSKYRLAGVDAERLIDRVITRSAAAVSPGRVIYTPWCDVEGRLIDDGTIHHLDDGAWRWTAAEGQRGGWSSTPGAWTSPSMTRRTPWRPWHFRARSLVPSSNR